MQAMQFEATHAQAASNLILADKAAHYNPCNPTNWSVFSFAVDVFFKTFI